MRGSAGEGSVIVAGSANVDFVVRAPHIPRPGETVLGGELTIAAGGKGANQAVACARAGGARTVMVAALGEDMFAPLLTASLQDAGVRLVPVASGRSTGAALITVSDDAANAITVAPGANGDLAPEHLPDFGDSNWLVMQFETPMPTVIAYAQRAKDHGVNVLVNAAPAQVLPEALLAAIDVLVVNEEELAVISGWSGSIAERLAAIGVARVVVTLGERGSCSYVDGAYLLQPAFSVVPVDTTGAGDTFCGTLAAGLAEKLDFPDAIRRASAAAALATTKAGAQPGIPGRAEVDALLSTGAIADHGALRDYCGVGELQAYP